MPAIIHPDLTCLTIDLLTSKTWSMLFINQGSDNPPIRINLDNSRKASNILENRPKYDSSLGEVPANNDKYGAL